MTLGSFRLLNHSPFAGRIPQIHWLLLVSACHEYPTTHRENTVSGNI